MKWSDFLEIAIALCEAHPEVDPQYVRYTDMHSWICALPEFSDDPEKSNERILEAIQLAWIEEAAD
ncbi:MAG: Fe-S cluster assembly protein IscX [Proteobacteria bacterium]|nr:Fe-S cluster assembly protein IscX [Pseudomonadota bacterium]MCH9758351.1 Fe-S cluster assembly protein IscX [Pseudomonadota bacterium]